MSLQTIIVYYFFLALGTILPVLIAVAFFTLAERKIMAFVQRRRGPDVVGFWGLLQPIADALKLIIAEPNDRLGATDYSQLKSHEFFKSVDWTSSLVNSLPPCDS